MCLFNVGHILLAEEMELYHSVCLENLARISEDPDFLFRVITVDESLIHHYSLKTKCESEARVANLG